MCSKSAAGWVGGRLAGWLGAGCKFVCAFGGLSVYRGGHAHVCTCVW